jgi:hypothetical protein
MSVTCGWIVTKLGEYFPDHTANYITEGKEKSNLYKRSNSITNVEENGFSIINIEENGFDHMSVTYGWIVTKLGEYFLHHAVNYLT